MHAILAALLISSASLKGGALLVHQLNPRLPVDRAQRLGRAIDRSAAKWNVDAGILAAILAQESFFQTGLERCYGRSLKNLRVSGWTCDIGLAQINWETWGQKFGLNRCKLRYDDVYAIDVAARILARIKRYIADEDTDPRWWSIYHDARPQHREQYEALVLARMEKMAYE